jgi:hypothetical protein
LRVVRCPTTYGAPTSPQPLPATLRADVSAQLAARLEYHADGAQTLLAPRGWRCRAAVGADGGASMSVFPPGSDSRHPVEAVTAESEPACQGCIYDLACPLFPAAERLMHRIFGEGCSTRRPAAELVRRVGAEVVDFTDPPGVEGDGEPSGGRYPANGVAVFVLPPGHRYDGAAKETCTLPAAERAVCTAILDDFLAHDYPS